MKNKWVMIHKGLAMYIGLGVFVQLFLAGIWHAGVVMTPDAHALFGASLLLAALIALIAAAVGKLPKAVIGRTGLLFALILLQPFLIEARVGSLPLISAFHTLNAGVIGMVSGTVVATGQQQAAVENTAVSSVAGD